ncbi:penicillin-binding transpeptidase domain-containing protein [Deinococcus malanensis]|uniref:penicillin-binding transpeptidase domain-containing protein n=1 Tax=Deinococcus malanensis TaxID=1706855 RepID=UPI001E5FBADD|nr:penicillin-binding transpeptidase domain-containing protein [Deinococcus malanensis]
MSSTPTHGRQVSRFTRPRLTIQNVLRYSSNVGISHIVEPYTDEKFRARLSQFGIGTAPELPLRCS